LTSTRVVGVDVAVNVEPLVDLDIDPASRCKVDEGVNDYVAVEVHVEGQGQGSRSRVKVKLVAGERARGANVEATATPATVEHRLFRVVFHHVPGELQGGRMPCVDP
jgi:hypothetical protein